MTAARALVLCGTGFGDDHLAALATLRDRLQPIGVFAEADATARALAERIGVPHWTQPEQLPAEAGGGWVSARGHGTSPGARTADLLSRGIPVLTDAALGHDELTHCLRLARRSDATLRIGIPVSGLPATQRFLGAAQVVRERQAIRHVAASCHRDDLQPLLDVLATAIGRVRPWQIDASFSGGPWATLSLRLADVPVLLRVRSHDSCEPSASMDIALDAGSGELSLHGVQGPVTWTSWETGNAVELGGPRRAAERNAAWTGAIGAELSAFADTLAAGASTIGDLQQRLVLSQLRHELLQAVGRLCFPNASGAAQGGAVAVCELEAAAVARAGDDRTTAVALPRAMDLDATGREALRIRLKGGLTALDSFVPTLRRLERISLSAISQLLYATGALPEDESRSADRMIAGLGTAPRHAWLVRRWLDALCQTGALIETESGYRWLERPQEAPDSDRSRLLAELYETLGFPPAMARFHATTLAHLGRLVRDELSVQQLLFEDGEPLQALASYQDNAFTAYLNAACAHLLRRCPSRTSTLRVIELGGGAGLGTAAALDALQDRELDYLFTDVSRMFTVAAQQRYGERSDLRYGLIDINTEFAEQGIAPQSADAVLAGNVLHNAEHIGRTLRRIRRALAPGGWLVFTESTHENHAVLTSMQFLLSPAPGAALPGHDDCRAGTGRIFVDAAGWLAELSDAGFGVRFVLPADTNDALTVAGQRLFFAIAQ